MELKHTDDVASKPTVIPNIEITEKGDYDFKISNGTWNSRKGKAKVSLLFDRVPQLKDEKLQREDRPLRLNIAVYAISKDGTRIDRLIHDGYFTTNEPFSKAGEHLWSSWSSAEFEYGLAGFWANPKENVFIHIQITEPDARLALGNPRLIVSGDYDYAALPRIRLFLLIGYEILIFFAFAPIILIYFIVKKYNKTKVTT